MSGGFLKTINVTFDDVEYGEILKKKGNTSWHDFILREDKNDKSI